MHRLLILSALLFVCGCRPPYGAQPVAGTYAVWICGDTCAVSDTANAAVAGFLVLNATPFPKAAAESGAFGESIYHRRKDGTPNACFNLTTRRRETLAGITPRGLTTWTMRGDTVNVLLYASPDASSSLDAVANDGRLLGRTRDSGFVFTSFDDWRGPALGIRLGPPDEARCRKS